VGITLRKGDEAMVVELIQLATTGANGIYTEMLMTSSSDVESIQQPCTHARTIHHMMHSKKKKCKEYYDPRMHIWNCRCLGQSSWSVYQQCQFERLQMARLSLQARMHYGGLAISQEVPAFLTRPV
jgi:hypothetical protein